MSVYICGTSKDCLCCGNDIGDSIGVCWDCIAGNFDCENCFGRGIPFDRFSEGITARLHKFTHWTDGPKSTAVAVCGEEVPYDDLGQGVAALDNCTICWREESCLTDSESHQVVPSG